MRSKPWNRWRRSKTAWLLLGLLLLPLLCRATDQDQRRILIGIKIFPAVLAADSDITNKAIDGRLDLFLLYRSDRGNAERLAKRVTTFAPIRKLLIHPHVLTYGELNHYTGPAPAGVFLTEKADDKLPALMQYVEHHHVIVFSPFEGDVERGVTTGLYVSDQILPYVNIESLRRSAIVLRPFFMEIAKHYE